MAIPSDITMPSASGSRRCKSPSDCEKSIREDYAKKLDQFEKGVLDAISRLFADFRIRNDSQLRSDTEGEVLVGGLETE